MLSVPYSRYVFGMMPWYSFLIVTGAAAAVVLASVEEKRCGLKKDTVIDFSLIVLPCGIIGARIYYVVFSWESFRNDLLSVFRIWEGGIAIYGGIIAGLLAASVFCRVRKISFFTLCDIFAPGLVLAQAIGRWGNYFNQEAYGILLQNPDLCFFPFAVQIQTDTGLQWHMATFFYESCWDIAVFIFLMIARRNWFRYHGDVISFYALLYACGRMVIEDLRLDSLYALPTIRVSQLLSVLVCITVFFRYLILFGFSKRHIPICLFILLSVCMLYDAAAIFFMTGIIPYPASDITGHLLILLLCSVLNIVTLFAIYGNCAEGEIIYADIKG